MNKELITYQIYNTCFELQQKLEENALGLEEYKGRDIGEIKETFVTLIGTLLSIKDEDEFMINALSEHIKTLQDRKSRLEQRISNIKKTILNAFEMSDTHKIIAPNGTISTILRNTVKITDENTLREQHPEYFTISEPIIPPAKFNSKAAIEDLKNGVILEGAELEKTRSLMFRK